MIACINFSFSEYKTSLEPLRTKFEKKQSCLNCCSKKSECQKQSSFQFEPCMAYITFERKTGRDLAFIELNRPENISTVNETKLIEGHRFEETVSPDTIIWSNQSSDKIRKIAFICVVILWEILVFSIIRVLCDEVYKLRYRYPYQD